MTALLASPARPKLGPRMAALWVLVGLAALTAAFARLPMEPVADHAVTASEQGLTLSLARADIAPDGYAIRVRIAETTGAAVDLQARQMQLAGQDGALCPVATPSPLIRLAGGGDIDVTYVFPFRECYEPIAVDQAITVVGRLQLMRDGQRGEVKLRLSR
jgi:hypothetical protein